MWVSIDRKRCCDTLSIYLNKHSNGNVDHYEKNIHHILLGLYMIAVKIFMEW